MKLFVAIECTDVADSLALKVRIEKFLKILDKGDYCGREVSIIKASKR